MHNYKSIIIHARDLHFTLVDETKWKEKRTKQKQNCGIRRKSLSITCVTVTETNYTMANKTLTAQNASGAYAQKA
jgi:hypothetical protein